MGIVDPEERDAALFGLLGCAAVGFSSRNIEPAHVLAVPIPQRLAIDDLGDRDRVIAREGVDVDLHALLALREVASLDDLDHWGDP